MEDRKAGGVAVVGCGAWGRNLARCLAELGALAGVVDHHAGAARALGERHGCRALTLDAALADPAVAAIAIATQPARHLAVAMAALDAGRHLLVEKPLTLDLADAEALVRAARARSRVLMVGHILHYHPGFIALRRLVTEGALGRLRRIRATRLNLGAVRREESALWCLAPHDVSMVLALTGGPPESVTALADHPLGRPAADTATLRLGFAGGASAQIEVSWLHPFKEQRLVAIGTEAMAVLDDAEPWERKLVLHPVRVGPDGGICRGPPEPVALTPAEPLLEECRHFLACIADGTEPRTGGAEALAVMAVLAEAERVVACPDMDRTEKVKSPCPTA